MFPGPSFYYITVALQAACAWHCIRRGTQQKWIWVIVFLPIIGCLIYLFSEVLTDRGLRGAGSGLGSLLNPGGSVRRLEKQVAFSDTFQNRIALADACLESGDTARAVALYESILTGLFAENEYVIGQLVQAYARQERYEDILPLARKIAGLLSFTRSKAHLCYAIALGKCGHTEAAEAEFAQMNGRYGSFEPRYQYGVFLRETGRTDEAAAQFRSLVDEFKYLGGRERHLNRPWYARAKDGLRATPHASA
ncbi:MAG: hypothetical protein JWP27_934 [Flaviaesturariibacter sp.]|nr:hypothetical protein [Flaviaesturariibacter sp.]